MKAAFYKNFGDADEVFEVGEREIPPLNPGEVRVDIKHSGVNPSDVKKRAGQRGEFHDSFVIPHSDGTGVITDVASDVDHSRIGERVWVYQAQYERNWGTAAGAVNLPANRAAPLPDNATFAEGAAIGIPMMTAHRCLTSSGDIEGKVILVTGALGRVGFYAVQMGSQLGARVVTTVSDRDEGVSLLDLGAELVTSYNDPGYPDQVRAHIGGNRVDLVVDVEFGFNLPGYLPLLSQNATIASYASSRNPTPEIPFYDLMFNNIFVHPILVYAMPEAAKQHAIHDINRMLAAGAISHRIAAEYPLEQIAVAHQAVEQNRYRGSVLLKID